MNVAIDCRWIFPEISGIGTYTRELVGQLALIDTENRYLLLFDDEVLRDRTLEEANLAGRSNFSASVIPYGVFSLRNQFKLGSFLEGNGIDVFHSPNFMIPMKPFPRRKRGETACVVTIHDLIPMLFRKEVPRSKKTRIYPIYRRLMMEVGARADSIITVSEASRRDVIEHLHIPDSDSDKVHAVYNGVSPRFTSAEVGRKGHGTESTRTIMYVGRVDPYKNLLMLIRAFDSLRRSCEFPVELRVIGSPDPRYPEASDLAGALGLTDCVRWSGYLSDEELLEEYRTADLLVHPSKYEGFGLQIAEAMACGLPVVCSNGGSLPEVAGEAAVVLDPDDTEGFTENMRRILSDSDLARDMAVKGLVQARKFTWARSAAETLKIYRQATSP